MVKRVTEEKAEEIRYRAEPTLSLFHNSDAIVRGVRGPVGSGKTVGCCFEIFRRAMSQEAFRGVRYSRWAFVRNTYPELLSTTLKTWNDWFSHYSKVRKSPPISGVMEMPLPDGTRLHLELWFLALDVPKDLKKLKSAETTGIFLNEASELSREIFDKATERIGRYPKDSRGGPSWSGVIMDTNSCPDDHWWYELAERYRPPDWDFFTQPPALLRFEEYERLECFYSENEGYYRKLRDYYLSMPEGRRPRGYDNFIRQDALGNWYMPNPVAENYAHQPFGVFYWLNLLSGKSQNYIKVFVLNEYGQTGDGLPVFPDYRDDFHCAKEDLEPVDGVSLSLGFDFGLSPACVVTQIQPNGQKWVIDEKVTTEHGSLDIRRFSRRVLVPYLLDNFLSFLQAGIIFSVGDPAGSIRKDTDAKTCFIILNETPFTGSIRRDNIAFDEIYKGEVMNTIPDIYIANARALCDDNYVKLIKAAAKQGRVSLGDIGVYTRPAGRANLLAPRLDAVNKYLLKNDDSLDGQPGLLLSPKCYYLRTGFRGSYMYERIQVSGEGLYKDTPKKNIYSHVHDGLQYDCLGASLVYAETTVSESFAARLEERELLGNASCAAWDHVASLKKKYNDMESEDYVFEYF